MLVKKMGLIKMVKKKNLWELVRRLILKNYELLKKEKIREGFYLMGDMLVPFIDKEITKEEYDYFTTKDQGYASYRDDIWPSLEQQMNLERPEAKPYGLIYDRGREYPISDFARVWTQTRGFIFTEKLGDGDDIKELSNFGWTIIAGGGFAGFPTRLIRQLLKADERPVVAFHDADRSGQGIYRALGLETRRTKHLDIALGERVTDLGLTEEDAKRLRLRSRPEPPKYGRIPRWETSALSVLRTRMRIDSPKLAYVVAKMYLKNIKISPTPIPKNAAVEAELWYALQKPVAHIAIEVAKKYSKNIEGRTVTAELPEAESFDMPELRKALEKLAKKLISKTKWITEADYEKEAKKLTTPQLVKKLKG